MFDRSAQYKTKCAYWQCRLSELTNTLLTLTKRPVTFFIWHLFSLHYQKKWILTFNKFSNLQRFFYRIQQFETSDLSDISRACLYQTLFYQGHTTNNECLLPCLLIYTFLQASVDRCSNVGQFHTLLILATEINREQNGMTDIIQRVVLA